MTKRFEFELHSYSQAFDRLVDGELSAAEERALLSALDAQPEGWRQCALAFLESRAWKKELGALEFMPPPRCNGAPVLLPPAGNSSLCATGSASGELHRSATSSLTRWRHMATLAASIALAFCLGLATQKYWPTNNATRGELVHGADRGTMSNNNLAAPHNQPAHADAAVRSAADLASSVMLTLVDSRGEEERQIEVPVVETDRLDPSWLAGQPSAISAEEIEQIRRLGYRVDQERFYVSVMLDDGRSAIVPLDRAKIRHAGVQF
jgi:hypothetical protein